MITVLDIDSVSAERVGEAAVVRFLTHETVGAERVEGEAYGLDPGGRLALREERHQLVYVTSGKLHARYDGEEHELGPGQGIYCSPGEVLELESSLHDNARLYRFVV